MSVFQILCIYVIITTKKQVNVVGDVLGMVMRTLLYKFLDQAMKPNM